MGLCPSAEERLFNALTDKAVVAVNDFLAFKFEGKMCGLAVENTVTDSGHTFVKGNFYAPTEFEQRNLIKKAFLKGKPKINLEQGSWVILRSATNTQEISRSRLVKLTSEYIKNPPESLPIHIKGYFKRRYLEKMIEHYTT